jgi:hypothetical protein
VPPDRLEAQAVALAEDVAKHDADAIRSTTIAVKRTCARMGLRETLSVNLELDTTMEAAGTPMRRESRAPAARHRPRAAEARRGRAHALCGRVVR